MKQSDFETIARKIEAISNAYQFGEVSIKDYFYDLQELQAMLNKYLPVDVTDKTL